MRASSLRAAPTRALNCVTRPHSQARPFTALSVCDRATTTRTVSRSCALQRASRWPRTPGPVSVPARTFIRDDKNPNATSRTAPRFAFAFDIDGVLLHVAKPIPGATETLEYLQRHDIPFILLTNGGGKHERERVEELSQRLGVSLSTDNFIQSHTPFQELVDRSWSSNPTDQQLQKSVEDALEKKSGLADKNVLITGSDAAKSRLIAEAYGFRSVITPADILVSHPSIFPFNPLLKSHYEATARPLPSLDNLKFDAIFVFNDPRDWALDTQIITDLLLSQNGVLGTYSPRNGRSEHENDGWQTDGQPDLYFSNHDLFWSASYHLPRFGQGAFQAALAGIWRQITGGQAEMKRSTIGKPHARTYGYAERVLAKWRAALLEKNKSGAGVGSGTETGGAQPLNRVYMVGDNPESDIRGANEYVSPEGTEWNSILVKTGVYSQDRDGEPKHRPTAVVDDVKGAVEWALEREGWR
ncbi:HAD-superfamily subfamily IIA hydrolase [Astrocystis sublimbata]|nr:HAD-superfamily subfamily IIA hydrolase [Astrocystis sublimbata]